MDFTKSDMSILSDPTQGFQPEVTNSARDGHVVSIGRPIMDSDNNKECECQNSNS